MKREDVTKVFPTATDEQIDELLNLHSGDIGRVKSDLQNDLKKANDTITALRDAAKAFEGDRAALQKSVDDWGQKYNADITALQKQSAIERAVYASGARNPQLVTRTIDTEKVSFVDGKLDGLDAQLDTLKGSDPYLFENRSDEKQGFSSGLSHGDTPPDLSAMSDEEYYKSVFKK